MQLQAKLLAFKNNLNKQENILDLSQSTFEILYPIFGRKIKTTFKRLKKMLRKSQS